MNVIVSNKYKQLLSSLDIEIIKSLDGEFDADELTSAFQNFYFQRMILDITAIKNYQDIHTLQKLSISLDMDKVILLLDDSEDTTAPKYLSKLVSMGIYNFTKNVEGIMYLYNHPNTYRDVAHIHQLEEIQTVEVESFGEITKAKVIGVKNVTKQSGATTLVYMMKKQLQKNYKVVAVEVDKTDFLYFGEKNMFDVKSTEIGNFIAKNSEVEVILVDINNSTSAEELCDEVLYLIEPSTIKLNRLMMINRKVFATLKDKKIVLCQSLLDSKDILDFEYEAKSKVYYNLPPLDERDKENRALNAFLVFLGFDRQRDVEEEKRKKILGLF